MRTFHLQVKMWVQLLIPRIEDGNNFGVSIQEETVAELRTVEGEAASYLDQISRYEAWNCRRRQTARLQHLFLQQFCSLVLFFFCYDLI